MEQNQGKGVGNVEGWASILTKEVNRESRVETLASQQTGRGETP